MACPDAAVDSALDRHPSPRQYHQYWLWERLPPSLVHDHPGHTLILK
jgi:hypothetical protein